MKRIETDSSKNYIPNAFVLIVFAVFAVCVLAVLALGISSYQKLVDKDSVTYQERTCSHYLYSKLRQAENPSGIYAEKYDGKDVLVIEETIDGELYCTRIYCDDGWLRESFSSPEDGVSPDAGEKVLPADEFVVSCTDTLVSLIIKNGDNADTRVSYSVSGGEERAI